VQRMQNTLTLVAAMIALPTVGLTAHAAQCTVQLGPRPFYLVDQLEEGELKNKLEACVAAIDRYTHHDFSIGHRGAALQFPEHTQEAYEAGRMPARAPCSADVLAQDVGIIGLFSDWPATTTFYANCLK
jgi:glycerophosphoryl diester phosphodiesterase